MEQLLTVQEIAVWLKIKKATLYTWAARSQIPCQKVGGALRFSRKDVEIWLAHQARKPGWGDDYDPKEMHTPIADGPP